MALASSMSFDASWWSSGPFLVFPHPARVSPLQPKYTVKGAVRDSPYAGFEFEANVHIQDGYPHKAPDVRRGGGLEERLSLGL